MTQSVCTAFQRQTCTPCQEETSSRGQGAGRPGRCVFNAARSAPSYRLAPWGAPEPPGAGPSPATSPPGSQIYDPTPAPAALGDARPERRAVNGWRRARRRRRRRPGGLRGGGAELPRAPRSARTYTRVLTAGCSPAAHSRPLPCPARNCQEKTGRRILARRHAEAPPRVWILIYIFFGGRISLNSVSELGEGGKFPPPAWLGEGSPTFPAAALRPPRRRRPPPPTPPPPR